MSGCPIAAVPAGFSEAGLPLGIQLIGPVHKDLPVLRAAAALTAGSGFLTRVPPATFPASP